MNRDLPRPVDEGEIRRYREDGAVCLRGLIDGDWIAALARDIDADMADPGPMVRVNTPAGNPGKFFVDFQLWRRWPACRDFALASPGAAIVAALTGSPSIAFYHDHLLVKEPGTLEPTPWHHDQPYYPVDGDQIVSLWLPVDTTRRSVFSRGVSSMQGQSCRRSAASSGS